MKRFSGLKNLFLVAAFITVPSLGANASDRLTPIEGAPERVSLTQEQLAKVARGEPYIKQSEAASGNAGAGLAVFRVNASKDKVWKVIQDFAAYPDNVSNVSTTEVYKNENGDVRVKFELYQFPMGTYTYHTWHNVNTQDGWITWQPDYDMEPNHIRSVGFWRVDEVEHNKVNVTYSIEVEVDGLASLFKNTLAKEGVKKATEWVKRLAEKR